MSPVIPEYCRLQSVFRNKNCKKNTHKSCFSYKAFCFGACFLMVAFSISFGLQLMSIKREKFVFVVYKAGHTQLDRRKFWMGSNAGLNTRGSVQSLYQGGPNFYFPLAKNSFSC